MERTTPPNPMVSIIVCTYNRCRYLEQTLNSIFALNEKNFEVIVVDNNSTDETSLVVGQYPVHYIKELRQGVAYARNTGLAASLGQYIGFIDDDELIEPEWLTGMLKGFELGQNIGAVTGPVEPRYETTPPDWMPQAFHGSYGGPEYRKLTDREMIGTGNSLFRADVLEGVRFRTDLGRSGISLISGEDTEFVSQVFNKGFQGAYSPEAIVYHLIPQDRTTLSWYMKRFFAEGVTEYLLKGNRVIWRRLLKPVLDIVNLLLACLLLKPARIVRRLMRLCQTIGILYGPIYVKTKK